MAKAKFYPALKYRQVFL